MKDSHFAVSCPASSCRLPADHCGPLQVPQAAEVGQSELHQVQCKQHQHCQALSWLLEPIHVMQCSTGRDLVAAVCLTVLTCAQRELPQLEQHIIHNPHLAQHILHWMPYTAVSLIIQVGNVCLACQASCFIADLWLTCCLGSLCWLLLSQMH